MKTRLALLVSVALLAGCGQKGPLYMPNDEAAAEKYDPQHAYEQDAGAQDGTDASSKRTDGSPNVSDAERSERTQTDTQNDTDSPEETRP
ncbi:lipoprotein [Larsenimonas salina]|nr:lipoprotein [Larsenimonas salina]